VPEVKGLLGAASYRASWNSERLPTQCRSGSIWKGRRGTDACCLFGDCKLAPASVCAGLSTARAPLMQRKAALRSCEALELNGRYRPSMCSAFCDVLMFTPCSRARRIVGNMAVHALQRRSSEASDRLAMQLGARGRQICLRGGMQALINACDEVLCLQLIDQRNSESVCRRASAG